MAYDTTGGSDAIAGAEVELEILKRAVRKRTLSEDLDSEHGSPKTSPVMDRKRLSSDDGDGSVEEQTTDDDAWQLSYNLWYSEQMHGLRQAQEELRRMEELLAEAQAKLGSSWVPNAREKRSRMERLQGAYNQMENEIRSWEADLAAASKNAHHDDKDICPPTMHRTSSEEERQQDRQVQYMSNWIDLQFAQAQSTRKTAL